jgi:SAM-dependent methyltransferase
MDQKTVERYQKAAKEFIGRYQDVKPGRIYELIAVFFKRKMLTLDVGCASGRDLSYLKGSGFQVEGLDAVQAFVDYCKEALSDVPVYHDSLPKLASIPDNKYDNVLLSAVFMHIPKEDIVEAAENIVRITKPGGRIIISVRTAQCEDKREEDGRLFTPIDTKKFQQTFEEFKCRMMFDEDQDPDLADKCWHNFVFEKTP